MILARIITPRQAPMIPGAILTDMAQGGMISKVISLREYQSQLIEKVHKSMAGGNRRVVMQLPTAGGKTRCASEVIRRAVHKGHTCIFLADRRKLIDQAAEEFESHGLDCGIIMAGRKPDPDAPVQVATIQTVFARAIKTQQVELPPVDLVIIDEAHKSLGGQYQRLINEIYPEAYVLGVTATPLRTDGRGLGEMYDDLVLGPTVMELQDQGFLVKTKYYAPSEPDMEYLKSIMDKQKGDYNEKQLGKYMEKNVALIGDVVENYKKLGEDKQAVVFASSVRHSKFLVEAFNNAGIKAAHIDGTTGHTKRKEVYDGIRSGEIRVFTNVGIATEGWNEPQVSVCILARPTKSVAMLIQMAGRVLRTFPGKDSAIIIDHSGSVRELGFVEDERPWSLDSAETISEREDRLAATMNDVNEPKEEENIVCERCKTIYKGRRACPSCGWEPPEKPPKPVDVLRAELEEIRRDKEEKAYRKSWYARALSYQKSKRLRDRWAREAYEYKFKEDVPKIDRLEPWDKEISNFHVHLKIRDKYSKQKKRKWGKG